MRDDITSIKHEVLIGLTETSKYLLSHHEYKNHHKCLVVKIGRKNCYLCARCSGLYTGLFASSVLFYVTESHMSYTMISILPLAALVDWSVVSLGISRSNNLLRVASGFFLGIAYFNGLLLLYKNFLDFRILSIVAFYSFASLLIIHLKKRRDLRIASEPSTDY